MRSSTYTGEPISVITKGLLTFCFRTSYLKSIQFTATRLPIRFRGFVKQPHHVHRGHQHQSSLGHWIRDIISRALGWGHYKIPPQLPGSNQAQRSFTKVPTGRYSLRFIVTTEMLHVGCAVPLMTYVIGLGRTLGSFQAAVSAVACSKPRRTLRPFATTAQR